MIDNKAVMQQALQTVGYYGLNHNGYEVIDLKESHVLRMFDADEITAQPVCLLSDAMDIIDAFRAAIAQPKDKPADKTGYVITVNGVAQPEQHTPVRKPLTDAEIDALWSGRN